MGLQSREVHKLTDYLEAEALAREKNLSAFDLELAMAGELFEAAQHAFAAYPILIDSKAHRAKCSLVLVSMRFYASAIDLCLRGNGAEAMSIMRSPIECLAYASKLKREPHLVDEWIDLDEKTLKERKELFGSDSQLVREPVTAEAFEMYQAYSEFGTHARFTMAEQATDFSAARGWHLRHAERDSNHVRWAFLGIMFTMRDLITHAIAPLYLEEPWPTTVTQHLDAFEARRKVLGGQRRAFAEWIKNPLRPESYDGRIIPVRGLVDEGNRA